MKIMQAIGGAGHGGAETFFVNLALAFEGAGLDQLIASRSNDVRDAKLQEAGIEPVSLRFGGSLDFFTKPKLQKLADTYQPDIFLSWMSRATHMTPSGNFPKLARLGGYYKLKYYQKCDHLIANTEDIKQYLIDQGWPSERAHYIPNFVNWTAVAPIERTTLDTPEEATVLLALGRLHENKAFDVALKTLAKLENVYLWIAGTGPLLENLKTLSRDLGVDDRVRFLGWRTDKEALFAAADICLYPSRIEPFGNVTLDAWASGTPIVAAASAGPSAYITHAKNGLLSPVEDFNSMANQIKHLINNKDDAKSFVENGKTEYKKYFTEQAAIKNWANLFNELINNG
ncbi:MAG: glycosyltransferase [Sneathiella sp.]